MSEEIDNIKEVVDDNADSAIKNYVKAQGLLSRNGSLKFLQKAEQRADRLKDMNTKVDRLATAGENDLHPQVDFEIEA